MLISELEVELHNELVLALAFARTPHEAAHLALGALARGYDAIRADYVHGWQAWNSRYRTSGAPRLWRHSITVLKTLEAKRPDGGRVAALSTPWGPARGPGMTGSYHIAWTRDLVETLGGLVAAGVHEEARRTVAFLTATQRPDGHWPHSMLLDGERVADREERDEAALPILLIELLLREHAMNERELAAAWPMLSRAAEHLARTGPTTVLDRWEDTAGVTPFTIATEITALRFAAELAKRFDDVEAVDRFAAIAARWDSQIEEVLYRRGGKQSTPSSAGRSPMAGYSISPRSQRPPAPEACRHEVEREPTTRERTRTHDRMASSLSCSRSTAYLHAMRATLPYRIPMHTAALTGTGCVQARGRTRAGRREEDEDVPDYGYEASPWLALHRVPARWTRCAAYQQAQCMRRTHAPAEQRHQSVGLAYRQIAGSGAMCCWRACDAVLAKLV